MSQTIVVVAGLKLTETCAVWFQSLCCVVPECDMEKTKSNTTGMKVSLVIHLCLSPSFEGFNGVGIGS